MFFLIAVFIQRSYSAFFLDSLSDAPESFETLSGSVPPPTDPVPTHNPQGVQLTEIQQVIVYGSISLTVVLIAGEAAATVYCRRKGRRRIPTELEQVMLPAPDDAYGLAPL
jgi:hypothetical protein